LGIAAATTALLLPAIARSVNLQSVRFLRPRTGVLDPLLPLRRLDPTTASQRLLPLGLDASRDRSREHRSFEAVRHPKAHETFGPTHDVAAPGAAPLQPGTIIRPAA